MKVGKKETAETIITHTDSARFRSVQRTKAMAIQIGRQNLVSEVSITRVQMDKIQVRCETLLVRISATTPNKPVTKLSVIFAIIQRKTVGEVQRIKTRRNPIHGFL
jgi:hypothetical protein